MCLPTKRRLSNAELDKKVENGCNTKLHSLVHLNNTVLKLSVSKILEIVKYAICLKIQLQPFVTFRSLEVSRTGHYVVH